MTGGGCHPELGTGDFRHKKLSSIAVIFDLASEGSGFSDVTTTAFNLEQPLSPPDRAETHLKRLDGEGSGQVPTSIAWS